MRAKRIFIALLALFFCAAEVRIGRAARQDPQPGKPASQTSNNQSPGNQSPGNQSPGNQSPGNQSPGNQSPGNQSPGGSPEQRPGGQYQLPPQFTDLVSLTVTVTDSFDRLVTGLEIRNFEVYEDKVKQEITNFSYDDAPVNLGIVFDVSGSMKGKLDRARDALKAFIQTSHSDDDFFLVGFNQRANLLAEFTNGDALANKLTLVDPKGQTALYDAAYLGVEKV